MRKKVGSHGFLKDVSRSKRDEQDAKMVSRPFKVNLYFEIDLIELDIQVRKQKDKGGLKVFEIIGFYSLSLKCSIFWVQF